MYNIRYVIFDNVKVLGENHSGKELKEYRYVKKLNN